MPAIKSLLITLVEDKHSSAEYIADFFDTKEIAKVSRILLLPYSVLMNSESMRGAMAFVEIEEWYDTEIAWEFIRDLNDPNIVIKTIYNTYETSWSVARNPRPLVANDPRYQQYVTIIQNNVCKNLTYDFDAEHEEFAYKTSRPRSNLDHQLDYERDAEMVSIIIAGNESDEQEEYIPFGEKINNECEEYMLTTSCA